MSSYSIQYINILEQLKKGAISIVDLSRLGLSITETANLLNQAQFSPNVQTIILNKAQINDLWLKGVLLNTVKGNKSILMLQIIDGFPNDFNYWNMLQMEIAQHLSIFAREQLESQSRIKDLESRKINPIEPPPVEIGQMQIELKQAQDGIKELRERNELLREQVKQLKEAVPMPVDANVEMQRMRNENIELRLEIDALKDQISRLKGGNPGDKIENGLSAPPVLENNSAAPPPPPPPPPASGSKPLIIKKKAKGKEPEDTHKETVVKPGLTVLEELSRVGGTKALRKTEGPQSRAVSSTAPLLDQIKKTGGVKGLKKHEETELTQLMKQILKYRRGNQADMNLLNVMVTRMQAFSKEVDRYVIDKEKLLLMLLACNNQQIDSEISWCEQEKKNILSQDKNEKCLSALDDFINICKHAKELTQDRPRLIKDLEELAEKWIEETRPNMYSYSDQIFEKNVELIASLVEVHHLTKVELEELNERLHARDDTVNIFKGMRHEKT